MVRSGDVFDLRQKLESVPTECPLRLSGTYEIEFPLYVNHKLIGEKGVSDGDWFIPLSFIKENNVVGIEVIPAPLSFDENALLYPGILTGFPKALIKPAPEYQYSALLFLGENASLDNLGIDNMALSLTENGCQKTGIYFDGSEAVHLNQVSLSTVSGFCYALHTGQTQNTQTQKSSSNQANTSKECTMCQSVRRAFRLISGYGSSGDEDDDKDKPWRRRKVLMKAHYVDVDDFGGDWDAYTEYLQSRSREQQINIYCNDKMQRTRTYQNVGLACAAIGIASVALLRHGARGRGGMVNLPWPNLHSQYSANGFRSSIQMSWPYLLGLPFGFLSQLLNFNLISIPKRQHLQDLKKTHKKH